MVLNSLIWGVIILSWSSNLYSFFWSFLKEVSASASKTKYFIFLSKKTTFCLVNLLDPAPGPIKKVDCLFFKTKLLNSLNVFISFFKSDGNLIEYIDW